MLPHVWAMASQSMPYKHRQYCGQKHIVCLLTFSRSLCCIMSQSSCSLEPAGFSPLSMACLRRDQRLVIAPFSRPRAVQMGSQLT